MPGKQTKFQIAISELLSDDLRVSAHSFIEFAQVNKLSVTSKEYKYGKYVMKGTIKCNNKGICNIYMGKESFDVQPLAEYTDEFNIYVNNLELENIIWDNVQKCDRCGNNACLKQAGQRKDVFKGFNKIIFGKGFDNTCKHGNLMFCNPSKKSFDCIQSIMIFHTHCCDVQAYAKNTEN